MRMFTAGAAHRTSTSLSALPLYTETTNHSCDGERVRGCHWFNFSYGNRGSVICRLHTESRFAISSLFHMLLAYRLLYKSEFTSVKWIGFTSDSDTTDVIVAPEPVTITVIITTALSSNSHVYSGSRVSLFRCNKLNHKGVLELCRVVPSSA